LFFLLTVVMAAMLWLPALATAAPETPRIAATNWSVAETLIALGITPYAVADISSYSDWVQSPGIPAETLDMGLRDQPNLELLAQNPPDLLISSALFSRDNERLSRMMPVRLIDNFSSGRPYYEATVAMTREIARVSDTPDRAGLLIRHTRRILESAAVALENADTPVYVIQFSDSQHVRVFGEGGMVDTIIQKTPLENAWAGPTNAWGFASISLDRLAARPDAHIVIIKPFPRSVGTELSRNRIWRHLPAVREGRVSEIEPVWLFGGLLSLQRLTRELAEALVEPEVSDELGETR
jgi:iron complex transport system substrate-binding protein